MLHKAAISRSSEGNHTLVLLHVRTSAQQDVLVRLHKIKAVSTAPAPVSE